MNSPLKESDVEAMVRQSLLDLERAEKSIESRIPTLEELDLSMSLLQSQKKIIEGQIRITDGALRNKEIEKYEANRKSIEELREKRRKVLEFLNLKSRMANPAPTENPPQMANPFQNPLNETNPFITTTETPPFITTTETSPFVLATPPPQYPAMPPNNDFILNAIYAELKETKVKVEQLQSILQEIRLDMARNINSRRKSKADAGD